MGPWTSPTISDHKKIMPTLIALFIAAVVSCVECSSLTAKHFYIYQGEKTWNEARTICEDRGTRLAKIDNQQTLDGLLAYKKTDHWKNDMENHFWIGLNCDKQFLYRWDHCEAVDSSSFTFWKSKDNDETKLCVYAEKDKLKWFSEKCDHSGYQYLCQKDTGPCNYTEHTGTCSGSSHEETSDNAVEYVEDVAECEDRCSNALKGELACWMYSYDNSTCTLYFHKDPWACIAHSPAATTKTRACFTFGTLTSPSGNSNSESRPIIDCNLYTTPAAATSSPTTAFSTTTKATTTTTTTLAATSSTTIAPTVTTTKAQIIPISTNTKSTISPAQTADSTRDTGVTTSTTNQTTPDTASITRATTPTTPATASITRATTPTTPATASITRATTPNTPATASITMATPPNTLATASITMGTTTTNSPTGAPSATTARASSTATDTATSTKQSVKATPTASPETTMSSTATMQPDSSGNSKMCPCLMCTETETGTEIRRVMDAILLLLKLNKSTLSATRRKRESAPDDRPSAQAIGYSGIIFIVITFSFFVLSDLIRLCQFLSGNNQTNNYRSRTTIPKV